MRKMINLLFLLIIILSGIYYYISTIRYETIGDYKLRKLNEFMKLFYSLNVYVTDDNYIVYYKGNIIKYEYSYKKPSFTSSFTQSSFTDKKELSEYEFKKLRDSTIYYKEHPYFYKSYLDIKYKNINIKPENYSLIDEYILDFRDSLISRIEYLKYKLNNQIAYTNEIYDNYSRKELIEMIISLTKSLKEEGKDNNE